MFSHPRYRLCLRSLLGVFMVFMIASFGMTLPAAPPVYAAELQATQVASTPAAPKDPEDCSTKTSGALLARCVVDSLYFYSRLAGFAGLAAYGAAYFLIPIVPAWSNEHKTWVRGLLFVLAAMVVGPNIIDWVFSTGLPA